MSLTFIGHRPPSPPGLVGLLVAAFLLIPPLAVVPLSSPLAKKMVEDIGPVDSAASAGGAQGSLATDAVPGAAPGAAPGARSALDGAGFLRTQSRLKKGVSDIDAQIRRWVEANPQIILDAVQRHMASIERENMPQPSFIVENKSALFGADGLPFRGNPDGAIQVVYFFDFACKFCHRQSPMLVQLAENNGDVKIVYRHMAILGQPSIDAARAAEAANRQGKFIEFYDSISDGGWDLSVNGLTEAAKRVGDLDLARWEVDRSSDDVAAVVDRDRELGQAIKVRGTPFTAVLNGQVFAGAVAYETLQSGIDEVR